MLLPVCYPRVSLPRIRPFRLLEACYDGAVPEDLTALAAAGTYHHFQQRLADAAHRRFQQRIQNSLRTVASWRLRPSPWRWHKLRLHSQSLQQDRHRAREAFDLCH